MASKIDLVCEQGSDLSFTVNYRRGETDTPADVSGGLARLQVRASMHASTPIVDIDNGQKGGISIESAKGQFLVFVPGEVTATYAPTREAVYDLVFVDATGRTNRVLEGRFRITPQVTR